MPESTGVGAVEGAGSHSPHWVGPPSTSASLEDLLLRCARRPGADAEEAFAQLYDRTAARLYGLAVRVLVDPAQAEEVTQEAYAQAWQGCAGFDPTRGSAISWLLTLAHRRAVDRVRSAQAAARRDADYGARTQETDHDATSERALASIEAQSVRSALKALTPLQQNVIELAYFQGHTHTEIAGILQVPLGTAKSRINDALRKLRVEIARAR
ncbi:ECF RNA polymerase sigma factor SigK [Nostocoides sp.]|uniref:ECF RNA polymerase sigma factor SigK n=1 Tax=Nostocoides sp. TaxID=1917966 RepID=UPI003BAFB315